MIFVEKWLLVIALIFIIGIAVMVWEMRKAIQAQTAPHVEPPTVSGYHQGPNSEFQRPAWASKAREEMDTLAAAVADTERRYSEVIDAAHAEDERRLEPFAKFMKGKQDG